jgi:hypothetical protein
VQLPEHRQKLPRRISISDTESNKNAIDFHAETQARQAIATPEAASKTRRYLVAEFVFALERQNAAGSK